jgi:DNA-binding LytR/AlgR family response regulator
MLKIAICDDEIDICNSLENIAEKYLKTRNMQYNLDIFYSADSLFKYITDGNSYDILFLDIEMEGLSGIEFGKILRNDMQNELTKIIYISWQCSYAMDLFKVRPVDFIIKPFTEDRIFEVLDTAIMLIDCESGYFIYRCSGEHGKVKLIDIMYFISSNRKITMHTLDGEIEFHGKLEEIMKRVDKRYFWRIHKSYIVNYMQAKKFEYVRVTMNDDRELAISQKYRVGIRNRQREMLE